MAGHSKWANIQHRKNAQDAKKGKVFTKIIREITVAARMGGEDPNSNSRLRLILDKAWAANMSRDTVERAIKRGVGGVEDQNLEEMRYEGYGPGGVAVMVEALTDNRNRTVSDVRHAFTKCGGNLGTDGSVAYLFNKKGLLHFGPGADDQVILELAIDGNAEDVRIHETGDIEIMTRPEEYESIKKLMLAANQIPHQAEVTFLAVNQIAVEGETAEKVMRLVEMLEDLDDVQNVYSNAEISEAVLQGMMGKK
jgi:YebC/PmpR family DNA-binding regulatory protein